MDKILFVSYNHGYSNVADSVQNHRLIPALSEYYDIDILQRRVKGSSVGIWSPDIFLFDRVLYRLFPFLFAIFSLDRWLWCKFAYRRIKKSLSQYQYLIMVYEPYTTRFLHYRIKKNRNCPKIISLLFDSYVDNIFFSQLKIASKLRISIESSIVRQSDEIVAYNSRHYNCLRRRYPNAKLYNSVFCGIPSLPELSLKINNSKSGKVLIHLGNIYGERKIDCLNNTISLLKIKRPYLASELKIKILGTYCVGFDKILASGNEDVITHSNPLYGADLLDAINAADGLLLIDPMDKNNTCFPSKLCEYYQYKKQIFGFSAKGTPSYDSLKESGHVVCDEDEINEMVELFSRFIDSQGQVTMYDKSYDERFYPEAVAAQLNNVILQA